MGSKNSNLCVGSPIPYTWPKITGIMTNSKEEEIMNHIKQNQYWTITEKLHGYNCSISSKGWIASRNKIIGLREDLNVSSRKFQGLTLEHMVSMFPKLDKLYEKIQKSFYPTDKFELVLFGEMMGNGTANSLHDIYNYKQKGYKTGHMYVFGLALIFENENYYSPKYYFGNVFKNENFYIIPLDWYIKPLLTSCNIDSVKLYNPLQLQQIFTDRKLADQLMNRECEGFILSNLLGKGILKWKYPEQKSEFQDQHLEKLNNLASTNREKKCVSVFKAIYDCVDNYITNLDSKSAELYLNQYFTDSKKRIEEDFQIPSENIIKYLENQADWLEQGAFNYVLYRLENNLQKRLDPEVVCKLRQFIRSKVDKFVEPFFWLALKNMKVETVINMPE